METENLVTYLSWGFYLAIFISVAARAIRRPRPTNINIAIFFAIPAWIILVGALEDLGLFHPSPLLGTIDVALLISLAYVLLRLVDDFWDVPRWIMRASEVTFVLIVVGFFTLGSPVPNWFAIVAVLWFFVLQVYAAVQFVNASRRSSGVTKRRMRAVAYGSVFLGLVLVPLVLPLGDARTLLSQLFGLASGVSYFLGFVPPGFLRRAWQEPELRAFLGRAAELPRLPTTEAIVQNLEQGAATSLGAPNAGIALWDEEARELAFQIDGARLNVPATTDGPAGQVYLTQRPLFVRDMPREYPALAESSARFGARALLMAPISAGEKHLGVLSVYAPRGPIFAEDDLELVQLLADQAAVILESRSLIDEAARVRAREEATRLKDDFLSAAAHDLKTPLTALVGRAQLLERRALRAPEAPADLTSIRSINEEAQRLRRLVFELLDATRAEQGQLVGPREPADLVALAHETCERLTSRRHPCLVEAEEPVVGLFDRARVAQLLQNLVENAVKYSPEGGEVRLKVWCEDETAHLTVSDQGIGIPAADLPHIFDRFYRAKNVDDRRFAGMGLGLFICRAIAEQHGGAIRASSRPGAGTTFHVTLPNSAGVTSL